MKYRGTSEQVFIDTTKEYFNESVVHHFRDSLLEEVDNHRKNGGLTVIVSASTSYICGEVKEYLGLDDIICTRLEIIDGKFTGNLKGEYIFGPEKLTQAASFCNKKELALENAYYYGDSLADSYLMEAVGNPVCVDPDWRLKRIAARKGWRIIDR
jgi:putative phosphoserine phosphatase/1-acylglycerol-3-phosphate O-acyltransferase